jgi:hypothetical protein
MGNEALILEGAKLFLNAYFNYMRLQGKTDAEIKELFDKEKAKFDKNDPAALEDVE